MNDTNAADAAEWLLYADKELSVAEHLLMTYRPIPVEIICVFAQQASEKAVKAIIVAREGVDAVPKTHDLFVLYNKICNFVNIERKHYDYCVAPLFVFYFFLVCFLFALFIIVVRQ